MPLPETEQAARDALKARLGKGARYDAANAPTEDLLLARRGTAYFARKLMELPDEALFAPSATEGLSRAHIIVRVSYEARHQALCLEALAKGARLELPEDLPPPELSTTLPARALRHLFQHSETHLNVTWRDLSEDLWDQDVTLPDGQQTSARALPRIRAKHIWHAAVELGNGGRLADLPMVLR